ncbi:hypothetical protein ECEC1866_2113, partial [Escherichia coli EC1866]
MTKNTRFS